MGDRQAAAAKAKPGDDLTGLPGDSLRIHLRDGHASPMFFGGRMDMGRKLLVAAVVGGCVMMSACNTVRGAAKDVESAANCTEEAIKTGTRC